MIYQNYRKLNNERLCVVKCLSSHVLKSVFLLFFYVPFFLCCLTLGPSLVKYKVDLLFSDKEKKNLAIAPKIYLRKAKFYGR